MVSQYSLKVVTKVSRPEKIHRTYIHQYKNEVGCRDGTVPKTVDTRIKALQGGVRACNNLPQPPKNQDVGIGLQKIVTCSHSSLQCLLVSTVLAWHTYDEIELHLPEGNEFYLLGGQCLIRV